MATRKRELGCACCGGYAGRFVQWFNQDTGHGICRACVDWMAKPKAPGLGPRETPEAIRDYYGVEGVNYEGKE